MILIHDIRLPLSAGEPQAYEKALRLARIPRGKVSHLGIAGSRWTPATASPSWCTPWP